MKQHAMDVKRFQHTLDRLKQDRTFFLSVLSQLEAFPRYLEALEWLPEQAGVTSFTKMCAPGDLAARLLCASVLTIPERERENRFPTPAADGLERCIEEWQQLEDNDTPEWDYEIPWRIVRRSCAKREFWLLGAIERAVRRSSLESTDQAYVLCSLGLVFLLAKQSRSDTKQAVAAIISETRTSRQPTPPS